MTTSAGVVLASLRGSPYGREYASPLRALRPCWTAFLNSLRDILVPSVIVIRSVVSGLLPIRPNSKVAVHNECLTGRGHLDQADGVATMIDTETNARLTVAFDNWFARLAESSREGNYWILDLDEEYHTTMVGAPDRRYLWILSRTPQLDDLTYRRLVLKAQGLGFLVSDLITRKSSQPSN